MSKNNPDTEQSWTTAVGAIFVFLVLFSLGLIAAGGWSWFQKFLENSAPAWVQAIGSIAAILAAIYMSRAQIASDRAIESVRLEEEARKKLLVIDALLEALESSVQLAKSQFDEFPNMPVFPYHLDRVRTTSQALARIDLFTCPAPVIQSLLLLFPTPCESLLAVLRLFGESFDEFDGDHKTHWPRVSNSFAVACMMIGVARDACRIALSPRPAKSNE